MLTPEGVIREARDLSPSYEERAHPNGVMLRTIDSFESSLANQVARTYPAILACIFKIDLPLASFNDGIVLEVQDDPQPPDPNAPEPRVPIYVLPGMMLTGANSNAVQEAELVNNTLRNRPADYCGRVGWLESGRLYLSGNETTWQGFDTIELRLVLEPKPIRAMDDLLQMPDWCNDLYTGQLVKTMAIREGDPARMAIGQSMMDAVWATIAQQKGAEAFVTVDVWPGGY